MQNTSLVHSEIFTKGLYKDVNETYIQEGQWTHARNAMNNSPSGDIGVLGNEPSNQFCARAPYQVIGTVYLKDGKWAIYSTDNISPSDGLPCEIGWFDEDTCTYKTIVNDNTGCLNFSKSNPIVGVSKLNSDCSMQLYWDDGINPSRTMNIGDPAAWPYDGSFPNRWPGVPYIKINNAPAGECKDEVETYDIDCDALRLITLTDVPCITVAKGLGLGSLPNGSYQATIAYTVNQIKVTDYVALSNIQPLWTHDNLNGSLDIFFDNLDSEYDEFELVIISFINQQTVAKRIGVYSTSIKKVSLDLIDNALPSVPVEQIPIRTPQYEKSEAMFNVNNYLIRVSPTTSLDFNYQPKANKIKANWVATKYPADYYYKGGNAPSFMRDEVYSFFIRWVYNDGTKSSSYHIPGRASRPEDVVTISGGDGFEGNVPRWKVESTATITNYVTPPIVQPDGGQIVLKGEMGYWQSTEKYPDNNPEVWADLCAENIRHHKFPEDIIYNSNRQPLASVRNYDPGDNTIVILGVEFTNIEFPTDNNGNPLSNIVGYEILRGSREGHRSILAKGLINNMRSYDIPDEISSREGLYVNYPYNSLQPDPFLAIDAKDPNDPKQSRGGAYRDDVGKDVILLSGHKDDIFSFHSPETNFRNPFLSATELRVYGEVAGNVTGKFRPVDDHPKNALITDITLFFGVYAGTIIGTAATVASLVDGGIIGTIGAGALSALILPTSKDPVTATTITVIGAVASVAFVWSYFTLNAADNVIEGIKNLSKDRQYALQYISSGFYSDFKAVPVDQRRRAVDHSRYVDPTLQDFTEDYRINNINRSKTVVVKTGATLPALTGDNTLFTVGSIANTTDGRTKTYDKDGRKDIYREPWNYEQASRTVSRYGALKVDIDNQYGQLEQIKQIPVGCIQLWSGAYNSKNSSGSFYGGDVYINRYTEKSTFFYFSQWMQDFPDGTEYNYRLYNMLPYPRYWMDSTEYDVSNLLSALTFDYSADILPNDKAHLDRRSAASGLFVIKNAYFYLFNSGIRDFYVESEINLALRDYEDDPGKRHYDFYTYTDYEEMFRTAYIKDINYYKYDYSLSLAKHYSTFISWGELQPRYYSPLKAETCYTYYPNRVIYSLQQQYELKKDNWRQFLANNYYDFMTKVVAMKSVGGTGAVIMLESQSPILIQGTETIDLNSGTKLTIGDGQLFTGQPLKNIVNVDRELEYGSCQSRQSVINTPAGVVYVSRNQGKVFSITGGLDDIGRTGMKWWFTEFLPFKITEDFPEFDLLDNTIIGVGCQTVYDNENEIIYFCKRDYKLKPQYINKIAYDKDGKFTVLANGGTIFLGDSAYFDDASWTISYDPKSKAWISFHDWHPNLTMSSKRYFLTVKGKDIWKHNKRCDNFCNFYGQDYPFEIEYVQNQGQTVTTTRSIEYILECYTYDADCVNSYHQLTQNFDEATIYNTEQVSGVLKLNLTPTDPYQILAYPQVNASNIDVLYSKVEQKYRLNQFWDITNDRASNVNMWLTQPNGYVRNINPTYVNYNKGATERKKFRHYLNRIILRKTISGASKFLLKIANNKLLNSFR